MLTGNVVLYSLADVAHLSISYSLYVLKFLWYSMPCTEEEYQSVQSRKELLLPFLLCDGRQHYSPSFSGVTRDNMF